MSSPENMAQLDINVLNLGGAAGTVLGNGLWSLIPVPVNGMTETIVADAAAAFALFERTGIEIYTTDCDIVGSGASAKSGFRSNILTTLAETRAKGAVLNPNAACEAITVAGTTTAERRRRQEVATGMRAGVIVADWISEDDVKAALGLDPERRRDDEWLTLCTAAVNRFVDDTRPTPPPEGAGSSTTAPGGARCSSRPGGSPDATATTCPRSSSSAGPRRAIDRDIEISLRINRYYGPAIA